ncbi:hypothetical protein FHG87_016863 [Trinorchestia longiramus]|nr:hypothetical protein FHG87_016863 [Trinorchestia longiramus]
MVDAARNMAWELGKQPNNYRSNYPTQEWATSESHASTTNEYRDEARFHRPMSKQDRRSEYSDEASPVTTRSTTLTNKRSRSGSRAQYKDAATLCLTDSLPNASKVNIPIRTLFT